MTPLHVLNTRPTDRAQPLSIALRAAGYCVTELPLLDFEACQPTQTPQVWQALHQTAQLVIVVSPMAAERGLLELRQAGIEPCQLSAAWIAVGAATAAVLRQAGLTPECPTQQNSEGLLALAAVQQQQAGDTVIVWRGQGGRRLIQDTLLAHGVCLHSVVWYRRVYPAASAQQWQALSGHKHGPDVVLISSGDAWAYWEQISAERAYQPWLLVLGDRLFQQLSAHTTRLSRIESLQPSVVQHAIAQLQQTILQ